MAACARRRSVTSRAIHSAAWIRLSSSRTGERTYSKSRRPWAVGHHYLSQTTHATSRTTGPPLCHERGNPNSPSLRLQDKQERMSPSILPYGLGNRESGRNTFFLCQHGRLVQSHLQAIHLRIQS